MGILKTVQVALLCLIPLAAQSSDEEEFSSELVTTDHRIELPSGSIQYTATSGFCPIYGEEKLEAELFFLSYTKKGETSRPITFIFPGGPGGAGTIESIFTFGPRRLLTASEGRTILPPYPMIDNAETLLEFTDLVFVDPVNCGFSRSMEEADLPFYYSVEGDIESLGEFIYAYLDWANRWNSPLFLAGSSYGTLRCCGVAQNLLRYELMVQGIILTGCAFEWSTLFSQRDKPVPDWLLIPTFAATAWYHGRLFPEKSLAEVVDYARRFAYEDFAPYMLQPSRLTYIEKLEMGKKFAQLIGLSSDTVRKYNYRINEKIYRAEFFGADRKVLGGLDSRYIGDVSTIDPDEARDPSYLDSIGATPAFNYYLQHELKTHVGFRKYIAHSFDAFESWDHRTHDSLGEPSLLQRLRYVMNVNPLMKVFVGAGYYDCRTPFAAAEYSFDHLDLSDSHKNQIQFEYYEAGHGFMFDHPSLLKWKNDLTRFFNNW